MKLSQCFSVCGYASPTNESPSGPSQEGKFLRHSPPIWLESECKRKVSVEALDSDFLKFLRLF